MLSKIEETDAVPRAVIFGLSGEKLTKAEKDFVREANPLGFILFARNCADPAQLKNLVASLHDAMGREGPILIDQEGGRVQRLKPPHWGTYPPAQRFGESFQRDFSGGRTALEDNASALAAELAAHGITVNCAPVMDVQYPETHDSIGDRAFSSSPEMVAALAAITCRAFLDAGVIPVVKHMPGQGRAASDSHHTLPVVAAGLEDMRRTDFLPFREILKRAFSEAIWGMVSHVIYSAVDARTPASCSRRVIWDVIRQEIGFYGLLLSDDVCMDALGDLGGPEHRAEKVLRAGCDVALHCNGNLAEMQAVAGRTGPMTDKAVGRYNASVAWVGRNSAVAEV